VKRRRKRSRKAKAGRKVYRNLLDIPESVRRKMAKRKPTPEEQAEFAETWRRIFTPGPAWEGDDKWEDRIAGVMRVPRPAPLSWERNAQIAPAKPAKPEGGRKFREVRGVLPKLRDPDGKVLYPDGKVPDSVSTKTVLQQVIAELARPDRKYKVSWHTVNRALARE
jgi:hypothetical protein